MTQCSPGVERVAAILNFMAEHPDHAVTVSDLVRALKISRSTCHTLVASLVQVGYLHRTSDRTYVLGPSLALVGQIAARHASPLLVAQPEMRSLAEEFDVICSAFFREGDHLVVRERAASGSNLGWSSPKGARVSSVWRSGPVDCAALAASPLLEGQQDALPGIDEPECTGM